MTNDKFLKELFNSNRQEFPDNGFSEQTIRRLPSKTTVLPQIIMSVFIVLGLLVFFVIQKTSFILSQMESLLGAVTNLQIPSTPSVFFFLGGATIFGFISYTLIKISVDY